MTKTIKIIAIILASAIVWAGFGYFGLRQFTRLIYSQRTCDWANIDNIEMHAQVDIPKIITCDCEYKKEKNAKMARFEIDKGSVDLERYIKVNAFKKVKSIESILVDEFLKQENNPADMVSSSNFYYTKGAYNGEACQTLLDSSTGKLWVTIKYRN